MEILGKTVEVLGKALDLRMVNQRIISSNMANVDTPGYAAQKLDFEASMQLAIDEIDQSLTTISTTDELSAAKVNAVYGDDTLATVIGPTGDTPMGLDGNNVNMDTELGELDKNAAMFQLTARMLQAKIRTLQTILDNE